MTYTVSEAAEKSGISAHALRFYDRQGLLPFMEHKPGEIRKFSEEDMRWLQIIHNLKKTGMPIKKIKEYIEMCMLGETTQEARLQLMHRQLSDMERQMEALRDSMHLLRLICKEGIPRVYSQNSQTWDFAGYNR